MPAQKSPKRPVPEDFDDIASSKLHCPELFDFSESEEVDLDWVDDSGSSDLTLQNPFTTTTTVQPSPRWPLEQPEKALTFSVLNSRPNLPEPATPTPLPELVEPTESASDEEFFDYDSLDEPTTPTLTEEEIKRLYTFRHEDHARSWDNEKFTSKKVRAAWSLIAPYAAQNREASFEQVLLAAHSLNNTSLFSGLARQTMAPEATY